MGGGPACGDRSTSIAPYMTEPQSASTMPARAVDQKMHNIRYYRITGTGTVGTRSGAHLMNLLGILSAVSHDSHTLK